VAKELGGKEPVLEQGKEYDLVFETVQKKDGSGSWNSVKIPSLEVAKPSGGFGGGGYGNKNYTPRSTDTTESKILNNTMSAATILWTSTSHDPDDDFIQFFYKLVDAAVKKYEEINK
jgi:hypothetical protein